MDNLYEEAVALQEWECDCAEDAAECRVLCVEQDYCCCEITWEFEDAQPWPTDVPTYCKEWDESQDCSVHIPACNVSYQGVLGELCTSTFDYPNNPYYLRPSFVCLELSQSITIYNPTSSGITLTIKCKGNAGNGQGSHYIPASGYVVITLNDECIPVTFCSQ